MFNKIISTPTFTVLSVVLSAFSLFNLYIQISESGVAFIFLDVIEFYRSLANFGFGWILRYLPNWVPEWLADMWVLSFILVVFMVRGFKNSAKILTQGKTIVKFRVKVVVYLSDIIIYSFYVITFLSILFTLFSPLLLVIAAAKCQGSKWNKEAIKKKSPRHFANSIKQKVKSGEEIDEGLFYMIYIISIMVKTYSSIAFAILFFAINAYGIRLA